MLQTNFPDPLTQKFTFGKDYVDYDFYLISID